MVNSKFQQAAFWEQCQQQTGESRVAFSISSLPYGDTSKQKQRCAIYNHSTGSVPIAEVTYRTWSLRRAQAPPTPLLCCCFLVLFRHLSVVISQSNCNELDMIPVKNVLSASPFLLQITCTGLLGEKQLSSPRFMRRAVDCLLPAVVQTGLPFLAMQATFLTNRTQTGCGSLQHCSSPISHHTTACL